MTKEKKEQEDTTIVCPNPKCGKRIYKSEKCSCTQQTDKYGQEIPVGDQLPYIDLPKRR